MRSTLLAALLVPSLAACFGPTTAGQRLNDAAVEMNEATEFGRMDIAMEHVGADAQESFAKRHASWGRALRIVNVEFGGMKFAKKDEAVVYINVSWQRMDDPNMRTTQIAQTWKDSRNGWKIAEEIEKDGDKGLIDEKAAKDAKDALDKVKDEPARERARRFQTKVISDGDSDG